MLTPDQIVEMEQAMEEEHRKDRDALHRLKRFLPEQRNGHSKQTPQPMAPASQKETAAAGTETLIGRMEAIMQQDLNRVWTVPAMMEHLKQLGVPLGGNTPEKSVGLNFVKLVQRGKAELFRKGAGRIPNLYKGRLQV